MSLETVAEDIENRARDRAEQITAAAEDDAEEIIAQAEDDAEQIREQRLAEAERTIEQERERERSNATLEARQQRLETRRDQLGAVREAVREEIAAIDGEDRERLTRALLEDAADEIESDRAAVYGNADDESLLETILADYEGFEYAGEQDCLGGVVVESDGSAVRVRNTFDSVLEDVWEANLGEVSERLFEDR